MAAGTERARASAAVAAMLAAVAIAPSHVRAQEWRLDRFEARAAVFAQEGTGWQSQAGPDRHGPGSQQAVIVQPILAARLQQEENVWHDLTLPVDVVTAASPDALDAISSASRDNESFTLDAYSHVRSDADTQWDVHWGGHLEETFRSGWLGFGVARDLADDNAVLATSVDLIFDWLDPLWPNGYVPKAVPRWTASVNASLSQLLSPTTVVQIGYGLTAQFGELATTWNSLPWEGHDRIQERLPRTRSRHAATLTVRQAIPDTRTFGFASYRLYVDDFGIVAHTAEVQLTQYVHDDVWIRAGYRFHGQGSASFYTQSFPSDGPAWIPRTADSDLASFDAHEASASVRWLYERRGARTALRSSWVEVGFTHYERTNDLRIEVISAGWGQAF